MAKCKKRSVVPDIDINALHKDERDLMLKERQKEDPDYVYSWRSSDKADVRSLNRIQAALVQDGEETVRYIDDVMIKTPKDVALKTKLRGELASKKKVERHLFSPANNAPEVEAMRKMRIEKKHKSRRPPSVEEMEAYQ